MDKHLKIKINFYKNILTELEIVDILLVQVSSLLLEIIKNKKRMMLLFLTCKTVYGDYLNLALKNDKTEYRRLSRNKKLICPMCEQIVFYRSGEIRVPHFYHSKDAECYYTYSENETKEHAMGKIILFNALRKSISIENLQLEYWISETKQRPDIYFESRKGTRYVIEFQCTPITIEEIKKRNALYRSIGVNYVWIFGTEKYSGFHQFNEHYWTYKRKACQTNKRTFHVLNVFNEKLFKVYNAVDEQHEIRTTEMDKFYPKFLYEKFESKYESDEREREEKRMEIKRRKMEEEEDKKRRAEHFDNMLKRLAQKNEEDERRKQEERKRKEDEIKRIQREKTIAEIRKKVIKIPSLIEYKQEYRDGTYWDVTYENGEEISRKWIGKQKKRRGGR